MRRYLIVDDNQQLGENLAEILNDLGDAATAVSSPSLALTTLANERFDALITDLQMPEFNGVELVRRARRLDPGLPAVVLTAYARSALVTAAEQEGLLGVLPKPLPVEQLLGLLRCARHGALVVVAEDDVSLNDNLTEVLRSKGLSVAVARSLAELDVLKGDLRPAAAIVDLKLPGGEPGESVAMVQRHFPEASVVVITAYPEMTGRRSAGRVFEKPFDTSALLSHLEQLLVERANRQ